jgi:hypothetical protein
MLLKISLNHPYLQFIDFVSCGTNQTLRVLPIYVLRQVAVQQAESRAFMMFAALGYDFILLLIDSK